MFQIIFRSSHLLFFWDTSKNQNDFQFYYIFISVWSNSRCFKGVEAKLDVVKMTVLKEFSPASLSCFFAIY